MNREENRFELIESRFHLNDKGVYVFKGIYSKNKMEENKLVLSVGEENIPLDMEIKEGAEVRRMYGWYPYPIDTEYSFSCRLPKKLELSMLSYMDPISDFMASSHFAESGLTIASS